MPNQKDTSSDRGSHNAPIAREEIYVSQQWKLITHKSPFVVLGNCWVGDDEDYIWTANVRSGKKHYAQIQNFEQLVKPQNYKSTVQLCQKWARKGHSHAMDWLGWFFEDNTHYAASIWYYVAALRRNKPAYIDVADRVFGDALRSEIQRLNTAVDGRVKFPVESHLRHIPEVVAFWNDYGLTRYEEDAPIRIGKNGYLHYMVEISSSSKSSSPPYNSTKVGI